MSFFSEHAVYIIKRRLYVGMRSTLETNWVDLFPHVLRNYNHSANSGIAMLRPSSITSKLDDGKVMINYII